MFYQPPPLSYLLGRLWGRQRKNFNQDHTHTEKGGTVSVLEKVPPFFISTIFHESLIISP
nr:MAG TPA_asm: hypothetical protein [Caudoviricetes sp.]